VHPSCRDISLWVLEATPDRTLTDQDRASYIAGTLSPLCFIAFFIRVQPSYINKICTVDNLETNNVFDASFNFYS
jgi:hypothetical protein